MACFGGLFLCYSGKHFRLEWQSHLASELLLVCHPFPQTSTDHCCSGPKWLGEMGGPNVGFAPAEHERHSADAKARLLSPCVTGKN